MKTKLEIDEKEGRKLALEAMLKIQELKKCVIDLMNCKAAMDTFREKLDDADSDLCALNIDIGYVYGFLLSSDIWEGNITNKEKFNE